MIGLDFETDKISNENPIPAPVCLSWAEGSNSGLVAGMHDMRELLRDVLEKDKPVVAHNATFELMVIHVHFPELRNLLWDHIERGGWICTQLYQQSIDNVSQKEHFDKSLAGLVKVYFKKDISESKTNPNAWRLRYSELRGVPLENWPKEAVTYAIDDSIWALKVYARQYALKPKLEYASHVRASFALNLMGNRGILTLRERVECLRDELDSILNPVYAELEEKGFMNRTKTGKLTKNVKALKQYVADNFKNVQYSKAGGVSVAGEHLDAYLLEKDDDILQKFRFLGVYEKTKTAFVSRLLTANPVIRTGYNAIVRSGRTSSRASSLLPSANIQQLPRELKGVTWDVRNCFVPRPRFKLVTIDYNNLELLAVAVQLQRLYGRSAMLDIINGGDTPTDLHSMFACKLMSADKAILITYEEFVKNKNNPEYKPYRQKGKPVTLGVPGGLGFATMRTQFNKEGINLKYKVIAKSEYEVVVRRLLKKYEGEFKNLRVARTGFREYSLIIDELVGLRKILYDLYPELELFLKEGHKKFLTGQSGWKKNEWGEWEEDLYYRYEFQGVKRDFCNYTATCNGMLMQSPSAVGAKHAVWNTMKEFELTDNQEVFPIAFIHDEVVYEIADNENLRANVDRCAEILIDSMQEMLPGTRVAVEAEVKDYWSKSVSLWGVNYFKNANDKQLRIV